MTIQDVLGYFWWKIELIYSLFSKNFMLKSKHNSMFLFECYVVIMLENIFLHPLLLLCPNMGSSISHLVLILLNKMGLLNVKIDILLRQLVPSFSIVMFIFVFGGIFLQLVTWLIVCPHLYHMTKSLIPSFFLRNLFIFFLLVSLVVLVLFILSHLDRTNSLPRLRNASSWDTLDFRRTIVVIPWHSSLFSLRWCHLFWGLSILLILWISSHF